MKRSRKEPLRGLTIQEPYASLIASGRKRYETRSWPTKYRGWIAIHAGKKPYRGYLENADLMAQCDGLELASGEIIAIGLLSDCIPMTEEFINSLSPEEKAMGFYSTGRYAWKIDHIQQIPATRATGRLGLWYDSVLDNL